MDSDTVNWSQEVFNERITYLKNFAKGLFKNVDIDAFMTFVPISASQGDNVVFNTRKEQLYNWYDGNSLLDSLDSFNDI